MRIAENVWYDKAEYSNTIGKPVFRIGNYL